MKSFEITFKGIEYIIDVTDDGEDVEVFVERVDDDDIPDKELLAVIQYLVTEGFVRDPEE
jgi:hypothetical protein